MINLVTAPTILTDSIFTKYVKNDGLINASTDKIREAAYGIAEAQAAEEIGTFISPTTVTGTHSWPHQGRPLKLQYTRVQGIIQVTAVHDAGCDCLVDAVEITGCAWLLDAEAGIIDVRQCGNTVKASCTGCNCGHGSAGPLQVRVVYTAGLPTAAAGDYRLLMGLAKAAELALEQIVDPAMAEGGPGDAGVQSFSDSGYSESRTPLRMTAFGSSARANYAANMLKHFKYKSAQKLGW